MTPTAVRPAIAAAALALAVLCGCTGQDRQSAAAPVPAAGVPAPAPASAPAPAPAPAPDLGSMAFSWESLVAKATAVGALRSVCRAPTATLDELEMHITTLNAKIANYADKQMQVKGGILIGIWDEAELAAIRARIAAQSA